MDKEYQKSKRLPNRAKFKHEVVWCTQVRGNPKAAAIFGVDENNIRLWWKLKAVIRECEA
jgi:hypothetical protein